MYFFKLLFTAVCLFLGYVNVSAQTDLINPTEEKQREVHENKMQSLSKQQQKIEETQTRDIPNEDLSTNKLKENKEELKQDTALKKDKQPIQSKLKPVKNKGLSQDTLKSRTKKESYIMKVDN